MFCDSIPNKSCNTQGKVTARIFLRDLLQTAEQGLAGRLAITEQSCGSAGEALGSHSGEVREDDTW